MTKANRGEGLSLDTPLVRTLKREKLIITTTH